MIYKANFHIVFGNKIDKWAFGTFNLLSRKLLKPVSAIFRKLPNFSLSATLTSIGTSVGGGRGYGGWSPKG